MKTGLILSDEQKKVLPCILELFFCCLVNNFPKGTFPTPTHPGK